MKSSCFIFYLLIDYSTIVINFKIILYIVLINKMSCSKRFLILSTAVVLLLSS